MDQASESSKCDCLKGGWLGETLWARRGCQIKPDQMTVSGQAKAYWQSNVNGINGKTSALMQA